MSVQFLGPHLYDRSLSCQFESGPHLYDRPSYCHVSSVSRTAPIRSVIFLSCQFSFWDRTYTIGHLFVMSVQFLGPHLYDRSSPCQFSSSLDRTYIDRSFIVLVELGPHLYRSAIFLSVQFESGPYLYRSVIVLSV